MKSSNVMKRDRCAWVRGGFLNLISNYPLPLCACIQYFTHAITLVVGLWCVMMEAWVIRICHHWLSSATSPYILFHYVILPKFSLLSPYPCVLDCSLKDCLEEGFMTCYMSKPCTLSTLNNRKVVLDGPHMHLPLSLALKFVLYSPYCMHTVFL